MPPHGIWAPRLVHFRVKHPLSVRGDHATRCHAIDVFRQVLPRGKVAYAQVIAFIAVHIHPIEHPPAVAAQVHASHAEEIMPLRLFVGVEDDFLAGQRRIGIHVRSSPVIVALHRHAAAHAVLFAFVRAAEVPVAIHPHRHGHIRFVHTAAQFARQRLRQVTVRRHAAGEQLVLLRHVARHIRR